MSESGSQVEVRTLRLAEEGVIVAMVTSGSNLTEKAVEGSFDVVKAARGELFRATVTGIDWIETLQHSVFKIVREAVLRGDGVSLEAVAGAEWVTMAILKAIRGSGEAVGDVVSRTAESLAGKRAASTQAA